MKQLLNPSRVARTDSREGPGDLLDQFLSLLQVLQVHVDLAKLQQPCGWKLHKSKFTVMVVIMQLQKEFPDIHDPRVSKSRFM